MDKINRRNILKQIGAASGSVVSIQSVTASRSDGETVDRDAIRDKSGVELLLDELGNVEIEHESRKTSILELSDGSVYSTTSLETSLGTLAHSEFDDGSQQESYFVFDDSPNHPYRKKRNKEVKKSKGSRTNLWPQNTEAALIARNGSLRFIRDTTQDELVALSKIVETHHSEIDAIVDDVDGEYHVFATPTGEEETINTAYIVDLATETVLSERSIGQQHTDSGLSIQGHNRNECLYNFGSCLWSLALPPSCRSCGLLCKASRITGWAGYVACFICLSHICGMSLYSLKGCYDAARCVDHWNII